MRLDKFLIDKKIGFKFQDTFHHNGKNHYKLIFQSKQVAVLQDNEEFITIPLHHISDWTEYTELKKKKIVNFYKYYFEERYGNRHYSGLHCRYAVSEETTLSWDYWINNNVYSPRILLETVITRSIEVEDEP